MTDQDIQRMRDRIDEIDAALEELQQLGEQNDVPAVERSASRMAGTLVILETHLPPELLEE